MLLHPDADQALGLAVRFYCVAQLIGLLELALVRDQLAPGGFLDWSVIGILSPQTRTRIGSRIRRAFRRLSARAFVGLAVLDAMVVGALFVWPSVSVLIAAAALIQVMLMKRHHITIDGSDQMTFVVVLTCLLGRIGADTVSTRAAVSFLAAELTLAYMVAGLAKASSTYWRSGRAFAMIVQTRMYGQPTAARVARDHPAAGQAAGYAVFCWESLFFVTLTAPPVIVLIILAIGVGFHAGCALVMGLNRFVWAFMASYPALLWANLGIRAALGAHTANMVTIAAAAAGVFVLAIVRPPASHAHAMGTSSRSA